MYILTISLIIFVALAAFWGHGAVEELIIFIYVLPYAFPDLQSIRTNQKVL